MLKLSRFQRALPIAAMAVLMSAAPAQTAAPASRTTAAPPPLDPNYTPTMTFDIASIRQTEGVTGGGLQVAVVNPPHASKFSVGNFTAQSLLQSAFGFGTPIVDGPDWLTSIYYNVQAKSDPATDDKLARLTDDQARMEKAHMLRELLADRMKLAYHWEIKETPVYALTVAKGGIKMQEITPDPGEPGDAPRLASANGVDVKAAGGRHGLEFNVQRASGTSIAAMLVSQVGLPVLNRTGLTGTYNFTLQFGREWSNGDPDRWPDISTAVQEQLGLKLDATKAAVSVVVIDHIEKPTAN